MRSSMIVLLLMLATFAGIVLADIPPDPGYKRVSLNLIIQPEDDFANYRFFVSTGSQMNEIKLDRGVQFVITPQGGGAFYRFSELIAIPKTSFANLGETTGGSELNEVQKATIISRKIVGSIELVKHNFVQDVPVKDAAGLNDPVYKLEKSESGVKATLVLGDTPTSVNTTQYSREPKTSMFWATVGGGSLLTLAFISLGVWLVRHSKSKTRVIEGSNEIF